MIKTRQWMRRSHWLICGALLALTPVLTRDAAEDDQQQDPELHLPPQVEQAAVDAAVLSGLRYLASQQTEDGRFGNGIAVTAIAGKAFLSGGHTPSRGAYRNACRNALEAILENQDPVTGYLGANSFGNYYDHGFATLFLAECYGMSPDPRVASALQAAIEHIHQAQNHEGGWRYQPNPRQADMSVTVSQIMALRAAYNVGIGGTDSQRCMERALGFVRACFRPDGTFAYLANSRSRQGPSAVPLTASGAMSLIGAGITSEEHAMLGPSLAFLRQHYPAHLQGQGCIIGTANITPLRPSSTRPAEKIGRSIGAAPAINCSVSNLRPALGKPIWDTVRALPTVPVWR